MATKNYEDQVFQHQKDLVMDFEDVLIALKRRITAASDPLYLQLDLISFFEKFLVSENLDYLFKINEEKYYSILGNAFFDNLSVLEELKEEPDIPQYKIAKMNIMKSIGALVARKNEIIAQKTSRLSGIDVLNEAILKVNGSLDFSMEEVSYYLKDSNFKPADQLLLMSYILAHKANRLAIKKNNVLPLEEKTASTVLKDRKAKATEEIRLAQEFLDKHKDFVSGFSKEVIEMARKFIRTAKTDLAIQTDWMQGDVLETQLLCSLLNIEETIINLNSVDVFEDVVDKVSLYDVELEALANYMNEAQKLSEAIEGINKKEEISSSKEESDKTFDLVYILNEEEYPEFLSSLDPQYKKSVISGLEEMALGNLGGATKRIIGAKNNNLYCKRKSGIGIAYTKLTPKIILVLCANSLDDVYDDAIYIDTKQNQKINEMLKLAKEDPESLVNSQASINDLIRQELNPKKGGLYSES